MERLLFNWFANSSHYPVHNVYIAFVALVMTTKLCSTMFVRVRYLLEVNFSIGLIPFPHRRGIVFIARIGWITNLTKPQPCLGTSFNWPIFWLIFCIVFRSAKTMMGILQEDWKQYMMPLLTTSFFHKRLYDGIQFDI